MAFDQTTRNRLARFVSDTRELLTEEFTRQLQNEYGLDPDSGEVTPIDRLTALDDTRLETARVLRETMDYYLDGNPSANIKADRDVLDRIVREQAFTVLNRLCALRMSEARGLVLESIAKGYQSRGFQLYARLAGSALGETGEAYRSYLFSLMDEFAVDLPELFDRFSPQGRLFPRESALLKLLGLINDPEIESLWHEDETIGWIYQYFNSKEERKAMRNASSAPRNSRELAVRNQFFTPRYVVEFLTDNTLGRIWYEMTRGETALKETCRYLVSHPNEIFLSEKEEAPAQSHPEEELSQEDLLKQPVYIPHRPIKDPRELKMLDPACGSMHFGLYAFDLFEQIYTEAWDLEEHLGEAALHHLADMESLHKTYRDKDTFMRDIPRLIIERNIHGVDIDPRAVQISGLSLWLRAQKSWQAKGVRADKRSQIRSSNVVCAEPLPGDRKMLEDFLSTIRDDQLESLLRKTLHIPAGHKVRATQQMADALVKLVRSVWNEMELAGEAGSLLRIEETLHDTIAAARKESEEKTPLFRVLEFGLNESAKEEYAQLISGEDQDFFDRAESLVLEALNDYVEQIADGGTYRWRLFTEDTNKGFEFINLFRMKYDVVLMNPPFGVATPEVFNNLKKSFPETWTELYACFVSRGIELIDSYGKVGAITSRAFLTINRLEAFREKRLFKKIDTLLDLGGNVMDAALVESCAYIISKTPYFKNIFVINSRNFFERETLSSLINNRDFECRNPRKYIREWDKLSLIPKHKLLYELDEDFLLLLSSKKVFEPNIGTIRQGMGTFSDFRFVHLAWEVPNINVGIGKIWEPLAKGGPFSLFYGDIHLMLNWSKNGSELCEINKQNNGQTAQVRQASDWWRISGCTYSKRSAKGFSARALPSNCIVTGKGPAIVTLSEIKNQYILGWLNSRLITSIIALQANAFEFNTGILKQLPWKQPSNSQHKEITELSTKCVSYSHYLRSFNETDPFFYGCPYITSLNSSYQDYSKTFIEIQSRIDQNSEIVSRTIDSIYKIDSSVVQISDLADDLDDIDLEENEDEQLSIHQFVYFYLSWIFGVLFGRWDGNRVVNRPDFEDGMSFFGPIPVCPPGMLQNSHGLPASQMEISKDYPFRISWKGILTDDEGNTEDILRGIQEAFYILWKGRAEAIEQEACQILGIRSLREYFRKPNLFFADHLKRYSKSRRAAPIYWPLSTPSCSYTLWLYYHRLNDQTLYTCVNDFVDPKLKQVSDEAARLRLKKGRSTYDEKELERLTDFERELKDFRDEILRVAKFWKPNLNDGVEITAAPLWKLFQHKPWQKRLKETWQKLEAGEYDWAHLAYSIWPERVREKCKSDKSLAIAHDLEELYVEPPASAKKKKAKKPAVDEETEGWFNDD